MKILAYVGIVLCLNGCTKVPQVAPVPAPERGPGRQWVDLQPGWRVRVVMPLATGPRLVEGNAEINESTRTITLKAGPDLAGYEVAVYGVSARNGGGVRVKFESVERYVEGKPAPGRPSKRLFRGSKRCVRVLHLVRQSASDHNAAILSASDASALDALTRAVQSNRAACHPASCVWVPVGSAVIPESKGPDGVWKAV